MFCKRDIFGIKKTSCRFKNLKGCIHMEKKDENVFF